MEGQAEWGTEYEMEKKTEGWAEQRVGDRVEQMMADCTWEHHGQRVSDFRSRPR